MSRSIQEILRKRRDFSPLLVHLTRGQGKGKERRISARSSLFQMLDSCVIRARKPHGLLTRHFSHFPKQVPSEYLRAVCLTETPPKDLRTVIGDIRWRQDRLDNFGLVFAKTFVMEAGGSPVIYLCTERGNDLVDALLGLLQPRLRSGRLLREMAPLLPLIETFGLGYFDRKRYIDFHWEREWRVPGNLRFQLKNVLLGLCDSHDIQQMERDFEPIRFVDPLDESALWGEKVRRARQRAWNEYLERFPL